MRLDRNTTGKQKYQVINNRTGKQLSGEGEEEYFVILLKDRFAGVALQSYALAAYNDDEEYAKEILELVSRAGRDSQWCKDPD